MARYLGPRNRIARRFGANVFGRARNPLLKRPNPPGMHGSKKRKKSEYGIQLAEKQKLKACYGMISERQLINAYQKALKEEGHTAALFMASLECRLDNILYRLKLARTPFAAHQLITHGHVLVNGKKVDRRSFIVEPGMEIAIREKSRKIKQINESLETSPRAVPDYLSFDKENYSGKLLMTPTLDQIMGQLPIPLNIADICDFIAHQH